MLCHKEVYNLCVNDTNDYTGKLLLIFEFPIPQCTHTHTCTYIMTQSFYYSDIYNIYIILYNHVAVVNYYYYCSHV